MEQTQAEKERDWQYDYEDSFETFVESMEYFASENIDEIVKRNKEIISASSKIINQTVT